MHATTYDQNDGLPKAPEPLWSTAARAAVWTAALSFLFAAGCAKHPACTRNVVIVHLASARFGQAASTHVLAIDGQLPRAFQLDGIHGAVGDTLSVYRKEHDAYLCHHHFCGCRGE